MFCGVLLFVFLVLLLLLFWRWLATIDLAMDGAGMLAPTILSGAALLACALAYVQSGIVKLPLETKEQGEYSGEAPRLAQFGHTSCSSSACSAMVAKCFVGSRF